MHIKISSTSITPQIVPKLAKNAKNVESKKNRPAANISKTVDLRKKFFFKVDQRQKIRICLHFQRKWRTFFQVKYDLKTSFGRSKMTKNTKNGIIVEFDFS